METTNPGTLRRDAKGSLVRVPRLRDVLAQLDGPRDITAQRLDAAARRVENRAGLGLVAVLGVALGLHLTGCTAERPAAAPVARRPPKGCLKFYDRETLPAKPVGAIN
jgi:hypothetical protein